MGFPTFLRFVAKLGYKICNIFFTYLLIDSRPISVYAYALTLNDCFYSQNASKCNEVHRFLVFTTFLARTSPRAGLLISVFLKSWLQPRFRCSVNFYSALLLTVIQLIHNFSQSRKVSSFSGKSSFAGGKNKDERRCIQLHRGHGKQPLKRHVWQSAALSPHLSPVMDGSFYTPLIHPFVNY